MPVTNIKTKLVYKSIRYTAVFTVSSLRCQKLLKNPTKQKAQYENGAKDIKRNTRFNGISYFYGQLLFSALEFQFAVNTFIVHKHN